MYDSHVSAPECQRQTRPFSRQKSELAVCSPACPKQGLIVSDLCLKIAGTSEKPEWGPKYDKGGGSVRTSVSFNINNPSLKAVTACVCLSVVACIKEWHVITI